jgi:Rod binding domain-containing protein
MNVSSIGGLTAGKLDAAAPAVAPKDVEVREAFDSFVGEVFFSQMLKSMRNTVGEAAYFNGGRAEQVFTEQLDQVLTEKMTKASAETFTGPMYELFMLQRS